MMHLSERELFWIIGQVINVGLSCLQSRAEKIRQISDQYLSLNISLSWFSNNPSSLGLEINFSRLRIHIIMKMLETVSNFPLSLKLLPYQFTCLYNTWGWGPMWFLFYNWMWSTVAASAAKQLLVCCPQQ